MLWHRPETICCPSDRASWALPASPSASTSTTLAANADSSRGAVFFGAGWGKAVGSSCARAATDPNTVISGNACAWRWEVFTGGPSSWCAGPACGRLAKVQAGEDGHRLTLNDKMKTIGKTPQLDPAKRGAGDGKAFGVTFQAFSACCHAAYEFIT